MQEKLNHKTHWKIEKYNAKDSKEIEEKGLMPFEVCEFEDNILVNAGINLMLSLLIGGAGDAFSNANSYLGVGDSDTAAGATQTDLQAETNKLRKAMNATYPLVGTQKITFQSDFGADDANFAWKEFAAFNASSAGTMLNRKVSDQGTKTSGQTWKLQLEITIS